MKTTLTLSALSVATLVASAHEGDYGLAIMDGSVVVGLGDHDTGTISDFGERVFASDMSIQGSSWYADEPGIFIPEASLPDNTQVSFTLTDSLYYWDGSGAIDFTLASHAMSLGFGPASVSTSLDGSAVAGFSITYDADLAGGFDEHFDFAIDSAAASGIYLLANTFSLSGAEDSVVIYTVFNAGLDEDAHEAALEYVESVYVPAPGASMLAIAGLAGLTRRRR